MFAPKITKIYQSCFKLQSIMLGMLWTYFCSFQRIFCWFSFPRVVQ